MWALEAWATAAYAGTTAGETAPGQQTPPPVEGGTRTYTYATLDAVEPWSVGGWAAGGLQALYPGGGIVLVPDPAGGVMKVLAWWPEAAGLQLLRLTPDGGIEPVRGAYPILAGATRRNLTTNPAVGTAITGYTAGTGTPTMSRLTLTPTTWAWRAVNAGAGTSEVNLPQSVGNAVTLTVALDLRLSATPTTLTITATWADAAAVATAPTSVVVPGNSLVYSIGQFARQTVTLTPPATAVTCTGIKITAAGMPAAGQMDGTNLLIEPATSNGTYFDGDVLGGAWTGTPELSTSVLAPVITVLDGECPLDLPVTYLLANPQLTGGRIVSEPATLDSLGRTWLTHPTSPGAPRVVSVREKPVLTRGMDRGVHRPMGRRRPVVVTGEHRWAPSGTIGINALSGDEYEWLLDVLDDGLPVLLRTPADYHFTPRWVSLGEQTDDPEGRLGWQDAWLISAPFDEVDAPSALVS